MGLKAGTKLKSEVCATEAIVIRAPDDGRLPSCGGQPFRAAAETGAAGIPRLEVAQEGAGLVGKRYVDAASGLELLCTKSGFGTLGFDGRPLTMKQPKPMPSSD